MKIVNIFGETLFAVKYDEQNIDELERLMTLWSDPEYLIDFVEDHQTDISFEKDLNDLVIDLLQSAERINNTLYELSHSESMRLDRFFKPLFNEEFMAKELSMQKGIKNYLRIYALKIDANCFMITGGAIKFTRTLQEREHTNTELKKIKKCRDFLRVNGVFDADSFFELIIEES